MADPYVYQNTNTLINHFNIRDPKELDFIEALLSVDYQLPATFDLSPKGYAEIHKHIFKKVYPWAGKFRTVGISKAQSMFCLPEYIEDQLHECFEAIKQDKRLKGRNFTDYSQALAHHISVLDAIHPFREGNGRTLRLFIETFSDERGIAFDTKHITHEKWMSASIQSFQTGSTKEMQQLLNETIQKSEFDRKLQKRHKLRNQDLENER